jgi:hypothetical protein
MSEHSVPTLLARIDDIRPIVQAHGAEADRLARLPEPLVTALTRAGLLTYS